MPRALVSMLLVATACVARPPAAPPPSVADANGPVRPPFVLKVVDGELKASSAHVVVELRRDAPMRRPLVVRARPPAGATMPAAEGARTLAPNATPTIDRLAFDLSFARTPADDLHVTADAGDASFGAHADAVYRFGRPAPALPSTVATGPELEVGRHRFGPAVVAPDAARALPPRATAPTTP